jgi:hypothetical protein
VREHRELALDRFPDVWVVVAVHGGPPRTDAVEELSAVR